MSEFVGLAIATTLPSHEGSVQVQPTFSSARPPPFGNNNNDNANKDLAPPPPPILNKPDDVPGDFFCSVCHDVPMDPVLTPSCEHMFCRACLRESLAYRAECPVDRSPTSSIAEVKQGTLWHRMWSSIAVTCGYNAADRECPWIGTMGSYQTHRSTTLCQQQQQRKRAAAALAWTERTEALETAGISARKQGERDLEQELAEKTKNNIDLNARMFAISSSAAAAAAAAERVVVNFDRNYRYDRFSVIKLSQLVCRYLEDKPYEIDSNRIFNCVRCCMQDYYRGWNDNPRHYDLDMAMLVHVCLASTWFTDRQREQILECQNRLHRN